MSDEWAKKQSKRQQKKSGITLPTSAIRACYGSTPHVIAHGGSRSISQFQFNAYVGTKSGGAWRLVRWNGGGKKVGFGTRRVYRRRDRTRLVVVGRDRECACACFANKVSSRKAATRRRRPLRLLRHLYSVSLLGCRHGGYFRPPFPPYRPPPLEGHSTPYLT